MISAYRLAYIAGKKERYLFSQEERERELILFTLEYRPDPRQLRSPGTIS